MRVEIGMQSWGWVADTFGNARVGASVVITNLDVSPAAVWSAITGGTQLTSPISTNTLGLIPGFIEQGSYLVSVDLGQIHHVEAISGSPSVITPGMIGAGLLVESVTALSNSGAAVTIPDVTSATVHRYTLTANCTLTFPTAAAGKSFMLELVQDATGSRTATWPGTVKWPSGTAPTLTTTATKRDFLTFVCGDGTNWVGFVSGLNYA